MWYIHITKLNKGDLSTMIKKEIGFKKITLGTCYYPEHWDKSLWKNDLKRMEEYGIEIIRVGEFAWNLFEPNEGKYNFDLFDAFLSDVAQTNIKVIMGTPTATPPAWLTEKYPEVLNADVNGVKYRHGMRRHYNYTSPKYQKLTENIVTQMAKHYGKSPQICGWQIDNELNCEIDDFFAESDHTAFRAWAKAKYKTLDNLNKCWGTNFWSQTYTDWSQVYLRRPSINNLANPHLALDSRRFISDIANAYCKLQSDTLNKYISKDQFITTNGLFNRIDYPKMVADSLDFITYDSYPSFGLSDDNIDPLCDRKWSMNLTGARSICPTFGIMEQQSGAGGTTGRMTMPTPRPGQMRLWTYQSIANGADFISYFRWRTCSYGTEIYWHGLNNYDNRENRRTKELQQIYGEVKNLKNIAGAHYKADIAIICDYDNDWDGELDIWHGPMRNESMRNFFAAATYSHTPMDQFILNKESKLEELCEYKVLVYPHPTITDEATASLLTSFVEQGGKLLIGARSGYKDKNGQCPMHPIPGYLSDLCGAYVEDFSKATGDYKNINIDLDGIYSVNGFIEILAANTAEVIGFFSNDFCKNLPAVTKNSKGKGSAYLYGSGFTQEVAEKWLEILDVKNPYAKIITLPESCELSVREKDGKKYYFILNYANAKAEIELANPMVDLLSGKVISNTFTMDAYGVIILN